MKHLITTVFALSAVTLSFAGSPSQAESGQQAAAEKPAQSTAPAHQEPSLAQSCKKFVQDFYAWYRSGKPEKTDETVLKQKKSLLSPTLYAALKADNDAAAKSPGEIVGLDFDPFLNAQDYAEKYEVGDVKQKGASYLVDVWGTWNGKKQKKPDVVAEVQQVNGKWQFTNMLYGKDKFPENENLLSVLKALKKDRAKYH